MLYEFFDSAEAFGTLILVYDTLGANERLEAIYPLFKPEEIYSLPLNVNLLRFMLHHRKCDFADRIVSNYDNIDKKRLFCCFLINIPTTSRRSKTVPFYLPKIP